MVSVYRIAGATVNRGLERVFPRLKSYHGSDSSLTRAVFCATILAMETKKAPGKAFRQGLSIIELFDMFPNDRAAEQWFERIRWPHGPCCPDCGSLHVVPCKDRKPMPYRCKDCRHHFSVRKGTVMQASKIGYRKWAVATYMMVTGIKGTSSMKIHRELKMTQKTAWFLMQRIREGFMAVAPQLSGTVEVDEMFVGGKQKNRHASQQARYSAEDAFGKKPRSCGSRARRQGGRDAD